MDRFVPIASFLNVAPRRPWSGERCGGEEEEVLAPPLRACRRGDEWCVGPEVGVRVAAVTGEQRALTFLLQPDVTDRPTWQCFVRVEDVSAW